MKRCPKCNQVYADDLLFCLADGTPLTAVLDDVEQQTVVRPAVPATMTAAAVPKYSRTALKMMAAAAIALGVLLFAGLGAVALFILWPRDTAQVTDSNTNAKTDNRKAAANSTNKPSVSSPTPSSNISNADDPLKDKAAELERERQKLADERKKLEDEKKRRPAANDGQADNEDEPPERERFVDPGPSRIAFRRGSVGATVSGTVGRSRNYVLRTLGGQYLTASVQSAGGCVVFSSGGPNTQFSTWSGDTTLTVRNTCGSPTKFSMSVTVR